MKISIQAKDMDVTKAIRQFVVEKTSKVFKKFGKTVIGVRVYIEHVARKKNDPNASRAKIKVEIPGEDIVVASKSSDAYQAIAQAVNAASRSLRKIKGKKIAKRR